MAGKASQADFAATAPWAGIIGKPAGFTPSKHAYTHAAGGDDPVALAISQIVGLAQELAAKANSNVTINGHPLTGNVTLTKEDIGLGQVNNTSDLDKPVSGPQQAAIDAAVSMAVPSGLIAKWSGVLAEIPTAWALCDGTEGTPDLRDKFIKGCAAGVDPGVTGGSELHTPTGTNADEDAHTHSVTATGSNADESSHTHSVTATGSNSAPTFTGDAVAAASTNATPDLVAADTGGTGVSPVTTATGTVSAPTFTGTPVSSGTGTAHTHVFTGSPVASGAGSAHTHVFTGDEADYQPEFYTLAFIMKR